MLGSKRTEHPVRGPTTIPSFLGHIAEQAKKLLTLEQLALVIVLFNSGRFLRNLSLALYRSCDL